MQPPSHVARSFLARLVPDAARRLTLRGWALLLGLSVAVTAHAQTTPGTTATVLWTAPGDDGNVGRATRYDLRYRTVAIAGTDTLTWWNAATPVAGLPLPSQAGATDSVVVTGLDPALGYYFIVRAADEASNWSGFSNVARRNPLPDTTAPAPITDLAATAPAPGAGAAEGAASSEAAPPGQPTKSPKQKP